MQNAWVKLAGQIDWHRLEETDMASIKSELDRLYGENWGRPASDN